MTRKNLSESQIENLIELVGELRSKLKRKNERLKLARQKLGNAKQTIKRLQLTISFQRERILDHYRGDIPSAPPGS